MRTIFISSIFCGTLLWTILLAPLTSAAQDNKKAAVAAFEEGVRAYNAEDYSAAAANFRKANDLSLNWKLLYNIGQSEAAAKRTGLALQAFEEYLTRGGDEISMERKDEVITEIQRLKLIVGMLEVDAPEGASVWVDGEKRDTVPLMGPIMISAGIAHEVVIRYNETEILRQNFRVSGGHTKKMVAALPDNTEPETSTKTTSEATSPQQAKAPKKKGPAASDASPRQPPPKRSVSPAGPILMAVGGAVVGAGLVIGGLALKKGTSLDEDYPNGVPDSKEERVDKVNRMALSADIMIPAGAIICVTGFIIWIAQRRKIKRELSLLPVPVISPSALGAGLSGSF